MLIPWAVEVRDLSKRYGPRWAVAGLSFNLAPGHSLLLTGPNGSGKTTLLKLLAASLRPTSGDIKIFGVDPRSDLEGARRKTALLSHANHLYDGLTARENLQLMAGFLGPGDFREKVEPLLEKVGLASRAENPVSQFSAGMKKRLGIARMLLKSPPVILLDEPFGELDPPGIKQMEQIINQLRISGVCLILATHLIEQGRALCDRQLELSEGRSTDGSQ